MKRVVVTGPESTGKTTLSKHLSEHFQCSHVVEFARNYLNGLNRPYEQSDLLLMAKGQLNSELGFLKQGNLLIEDTDLLTFKIWSEFKYGECDEWIVSQLKNNLPDLYLICYPDLTWEYDPLRENPEDGLELFDIYKEEIEKLGVPFRIIKGEGEKRINKGVLAMNEIIF